MYIYYIYICTSLLSCTWCRYVQILNHLRVKNRRFSLPKCGLKTGVFYSKRVISLYASDKTRYASDKARYASDKVCYASDKEFCTRNKK